MPWRRACDPAGFMVCAFYALLLGPIRTTASPRCHAPWVKLENYGQIIIRQKLTNSKGQLTLRTCQFEQLRG